MGLSERSCGRLSWQAVMECGPKNYPASAPLRGIEIVLYLVGSRSMNQHTLDRAARLLELKHVEQPEEEFRGGPKRSCTTRTR